MTETYDAYVDTYRGRDGKLPVMMQLKRMHTAFVVKNAEAIARGEGFSDEEREVALAAALLHDTGRYEQLKRYNTFRDSDSVDHAVFSHDIVKSLGWLDKVEDRGGGGQWKDAVLKAVLYHNRRDLPKEIEDPLSTSTSSLHLTSLAAHTVRDADKLDIFRVLEDQVAHTDWKGDSRAFWNLAVSAPPNPVVVACIANRQPVDYQNIKSLSDFVLIQVGWMISGLHFATARRLCRERGHLAWRRNFLHQLTDSPAIDRLCDLAERVLGPTQACGSCGIISEDEDERKVDEARRPRM
ncbi:MAG: HD domain-containing protein [bacterium]|nr:HD domain-containing protein [Candidatus Colisoma equi]